MIRRLVPVLAILAVVAGGSVALAQKQPISTAPGNSDLILSWRSNGFAPAGYEGRVAAAGGGTVLLTAEALIDGRPTSLSQYDVRWYVNDELFTSGPGLQAVTVPVPQYHQDSMDVRVEIFGASFTANEGSISVPLTDPVAVIEARTGRSLRSGKNIFEAAAYSYNVSNPDDLLYNWTVNGENPQGSQEPRSLVVSIEGSPSKPIDLELVVEHPDNADESSGASFTAVPSTVTVAQ